MKTTARYLLYIEITEEFPHCFPRGPPFAHHCLLHRTQASLLVFRVAQNSRTALVSSFSTGYQSGDDSLRQTAREPPRHREMLSQGDEEQEIANAFAKWNHAHTFPLRSFTVFCPGLFTGNPLAFPDNFVFAKSITMHEKIVREGCIS